MDATQKAIEPVGTAPVTNTSPRAMRWKRRAFALLLGCLLTIGLISGYVARVFITHNFHIVSPGQVYRSAQLDSQSLTRLVQENGIKTVLNLRGNWDADWYNAETNTAVQLGIKHIDMKFSAGQELTNEEMEQMLAVIADAPKPILIHCKNGADRTGLAGALYLYGLDGKSARTADGQLTMFCGHIPYLFFRDTIAMDHSFWRYVDAHAHPTHPLTKRETGSAQTFNN